MTPESISTAYFIIATHQCYQYYSISNFLDITLIFLRLYYLHETWYVYVYLSCHMRPSRWLTSLICLMCNTKNIASQIAEVVYWYYWNETLASGPISVAYLRNTSHQLWQHNGISNCWGNNCNIAGMLELIALNFIYIATVRLKSW
jgi:hypothetical protein